MTKAIEVVWQQITKHCWVANLPGGVALCVDRNRSWKSQGDRRPFKIEVLGNLWAQPHRDGYESLAEAQIDAEQIAKKIVRGLAKWAVDG